MKEIPLKTKGISLKMKRKFENERRGKSKWGVKETNTRQKETRRKLKGDVGGRVDRDGGSGGVWCGGPFVGVVYISVKIY